MVKKIWFSCPGWFQQEHLGRSETLGAFIQRKDLNIYKDIKSWRGIDLWWVVFFTQPTRWHESDKGTFSQICFTREVEWERERARESKGEGEGGCQYRLQWERAETLWLTDGSQPSIWTNSLLLQALTIPNKEESQQREVTVTTEDSRAVLINPSHLRSQQLRSRSSCSTKTADL